MAGTITETIEVDAGPAVAGLKEFTSALNDAAAKWDEFQAKMSGGLGGGADKLAASMDAAAAKISEAADKASSSLERIGEASDGAAGGVGRLDEAASTAGASLEEAAAGADAAAAASGRLADAAGDAAVSLDAQAASAGRARDTSDEAAAGAGGFGKVAKVAFLGLGVAAAYGIDKAMKFQSQMLLLNTQAGVSMPKVKQMSQGVLEISTQTGQSLSDVSSSAYHVASNMASMGSTVPNMLKAVKVAAEGASVGHANMVDVTNALTASIASGIPGVKNYSQAMGMLNATVGSGDMSMQDLSDAFGSGMVATVKGYGLSLKDVGAALATFGDNNIRGAKAGTDLRTSVQALAVPVATGATELKKLGLNSLSLANDMKSGGLLKALDDLTTRFKANGVTAKDEGEVITTLFGKKAGAGVSVLLEQMDRLQSKYPAITRGANDFNAAWEKTQQTPQQKWKETLAGLEASATSFGTTLLPAFSGALGFADKLLADINGSKGAAEGLVGIFGGLAALFTAKKLTSGIESAVSTGETLLRGVGKVGSVLNIPGLDKLATLGKGSSATGAAALDTAAGNLDGAAEALTGAAEKLGGAGELGEGAGGASKAGEGGAATAAEGAGGAGAAEGAGEAAAAGSVFAAAAAPLIGAALGAALAIYLNKYKKDDHPAPADQQGPHAPQPASASTAWKKYDQFTPAMNLSGLNAAKAKVQADMTEINQDIAGAKAAKLPAPDISALDQAKAKVQSSMDQINAAINQSRAAKVPSPDMSALADAKSRAAQDAAGIKTEAQAPLQQPVKMTSPDLSALAAAKGKAASDGAALDAGLAAGISANAGAAVSAAQNVAAQVDAAMKNALKISSPSKVTEKIGASAVDGLVVGLEGGQSAVTAAAQALGEQTAKASDVSAIDTAITKGIGDAGKDSALVTYLKTDRAKLLSLSAQRTKLEAEITDSEQIAQQAISSANITGAGTYTPVLAASDGPLAASSTVTGMQQMAADQAQFAKVIGQLSKGGLNATSLNQFVQAGSSSLPQALGLEQGGKSAISQVNAAESQIQSSAARLGDAGGTAMYQAGVQASQGLAAGLKSSLSSVEKAISTMATAITSTIKKDLKISSPSQVFAGFGMALPQGLAQGVDAGSGIAEAAVSRMGSRAAGAFHPGYGQGGGSGGGSGAVTVTNHYSITVQGSVTTENDLLTKLQAAQLTKSNNNWQGGWNLPGRAS